LDRKNAGNNEKNNENEVDNEDDNEDDNGEEYNSPNIVQQPTAKKLAVENNRRIRASLFIRDITNEFNSNVKITQPNLRELGKQLGVPIEDKILLKSLILRELENYDINTPNNPEIILTNLKNISINDVNDLKIDCHINKIPKQVRLEVFKLDRWTANPKISSDYVKKKLIIYQDSQLMLSVF